MLFYQTILCTKKPAKPTCLLWGPTPRIRKKSEKYSVLKHCIWATWQRALPSEILPLESQELEKVLFHIGHIPQTFGFSGTYFIPGKWVHKQELKKLDGEDTKKEERVIQAQRKRINQKSLVLSEFSSGFDGIVDSIPGGTRKEVKKYKKFQPKKKL